jgi:spore germination cell wall hydrolase CwlJ-like protein
LTSALFCLAMAVYFEARSEPIQGQYAVAEVIVNRKQDRRWPDTVCGVVKEDRGPKPWDCQFSFYCDGKPEIVEEPKAFEQAMQVAEDVLQGGTDYVGGALYYHTVDCDPKWSRNLPVVAELGDHKFFADPLKVATKASFSVSN